MESYNKVPITAHIMITTNVTIILVFRLLLGLSQMSGSAKGPAMRKAVIKAVILKYHLSSDLRSFNLRFPYIPLPNIALRKAIIAGWVSSRQVKLPLRNSKILKGQFVFFYTYLNFIDI